MGLLPSYVKLEPISHRYYSSDGDEYISVSKSLHHIEEPFNKELISYASAKKQLKIELKTEKTGIQPSEDQIKMRQQILLAQWADKNKRSTDHGTLIHNTIENYLKSGGVSCGNEELDGMARSVYETYLKEYKTFYAEEVLYSAHFNLAGTSDFLGVRKGGKKPVIDIVDYKTNASKGIQFRSEYGKFLLEPVSHLEHCNYIHYCLQQSIYGRMLEDHGYTVGQIRLIYIPPETPAMHFPIPVPYMKKEAEAILLYLNSKGILRGRARQTIRV